MKVIVVDVDRCLGCRSCQIACAVAHSASKTLVGALAEEPRPMPRVTVEAVEGLAVPLQCRHCEDAPCVTVCPTEAIHRASPEGPVLVDQERCIGCKYCLVACPFGVIAVSRGGKAMVKCDLCIERISAGEEPACVAACPTRALRFVDLDDHLRQRRRQAVARLLSAGQERVIG